MSFLDTFQKGVSNVTGTTTEGFNNRPGFGQQVLDNVVGGNIGGIFSTKPTAKYASGARCILKMNDKVCGFAFGISWKITTNVIENNTIDDYLPYELIPTRVNVEGTISALHIPGQNATTELWQPDVLSFLFQKYISIEVRDSNTDQLLFATRKAMITSRAEDIRVDQLANVSLTWKAIGYIDERTPNLPDSINDPRPKDNSRAQPTLAGRQGDNGFGGIGNIS